MKKDEVFRVRMSNKEKENVKMNANKENVSGSKYIRMAIEDKILKTDAIEQFRSMLGKLDIPENTKIKVFKLFTDTINNKPELSRSQRERIKETGIR